MSNHLEVIDLMNENTRLREQIHQLKSPARDCYHLEGCPHWVEAITENQSLKKELKLLRSQVERLQKNLNGRDDFIVNRGLWSDFMASLPSTERS